VFFDCQIGGGGGTHYLGAYVLKNRLKERKGEDDQYRDPTGS
jgi:hypothetical protein